MIPDQWSIFYGGAWTLSSHYDMEFRMADMDLWVGWGDVDGIQDWAFQ